MHFSPFNTKNDFYFENKAQDNEIFKGIKSNNEFSLKYSISGNQILITDTSFFVGSSYLASIDLNIINNPSEIVIEYNEFVVVNFWNRRISKTYIIDPLTGQEQKGMYPGWIQAYFFDHIYVSINSSSQPLQLFKGNIEALQVLGYEKLIVCQVYYRTFNYISESARLFFYYDLNSGILIKYRIDIVKNLVSMGSLEAVITSSSYSGFAMTDQVSGFFLNFYVYFIIIGISCVICIISGKMLFSYKTRRSK